MKQWTSTRVKLFRTAQESHKQPPSPRRKENISLFSFIHEIRRQIFFNNKLRIPTASSLRTKSNPLPGHSHSNHPQPQLFRTAELSTTQILYQKRPHLGAAMAEPIHLVAREDSHLNAGPIVSLGIGIVVAVGVIFMCCFGLCWWNRRKMRRQRAQEVAVAM